MKKIIIRTLVLIALTLNYGNAFSQKAIAVSKTQFTPERAWNLLSSAILNTNSGETLNVSSEKILENAYSTLDNYKGLGLTEFSTAVIRGQADEYDVASSYFGNLVSFSASQLPDGCKLKNSGTDGNTINYGVERTKEYAVAQGWMFLGIKTSRGYIPFFKIGDKSGTNSCMNPILLVSLVEVKTKPIAHIMTDCNGVKREMGDTTTSPPGFYSKDRTVWVSADGHWSKVTGSGLEDLCPVVKTPKAVVMEPTCDPNLTVIKEDWKGLNGEEYYNSGMYMKKNSVWYERIAPNTYAELCPANIASTPQKSECNNCVEMTPTYRTCYDENPCRAMSRNYGCCNPGYQPYVYQQPPPPTFWQKATQFFLSISLNVQPTNYTWNRMPGMYNNVPVWVGTPFDGGNSVYSVGNPFDGGRSVYTNSDPFAFDGGGRIANVFQDWWL